MPPNPDPSSAGPEGPRGGRSWPRDLGRLLSSAFSGEEENLASGPLTRAIPLLAVPMVLEMSLEALFSVCDVLFVAQLGSAAVATVGLTEGMLALVYAIAFGLAMPAGAMVARRTGEGDRQGASVAALQAILLAVVVGLVVGSSAAAAPLLLQAMGGSAEIREVGVGYARLTLLTSPAVMLLFVQGAIFRGVGDARRAMRAMWLANGLNILLDPLLIFGLGPVPGLGLTGAAVATLIGRGVGALYLFAHAWRGPLINLSEGARVDLGVLMRLARLSVGAAVQHLVETGSWVAMVRIVAELGSGALAAYTITTRIVMFFLLPAWGLSNATATLVGQSLGQRDLERAERAVWLSGLFCTPFLAVVTAAFVLFPGSIAGWFAPDPAVKAIAADCLFVVGFGYVFYGWQMVTQQAFNGAGDTRTPALVNVVCFWLLQIPLAWFLCGPGGLDTVGVFAAAALSYSAGALIGAVLVRGGSWRRVVV